MTLRSCVAGATLLASFGLGGFGVAWASASEEVEEPGRTPPRLSLVSGEVSFWRPGADEWSAAHINLPLAPGDALYCGEGANLELQIGARAFLRAGELTQLRLDDQEADLLQLSVTAGHLALDLRALPSGHAIEIDTPNAAIVVDREGYYRLRVSGDTTSFSSRRGGQARIRLPEGEAIVASAGERVVVEGTENPRTRVTAVPDLDIWDRWNYERTDRILESRSRRYVSEDVYGLDTLDRYGTWEQTPAYGPVWVPAGVPWGWVPYSTGRWIWDPYYGWTWLDDAPWGWAPYHYGRWVYVGSYWAWAPGPIVVRPYYAPALVAFFGGSGVSVHVGIGAPLVGWVALGWGEPLVPWWGRPGFIGRPCWYGWGGPRIVHHHTVVNVNKVHIYKNARVPNAVLALDRDRFGRGWHSPRRLGAAERDRLVPVRGSLGVTPVSASLEPSERRGRRPPADLMRRPVVATRRPPDPSMRVRTEGAGSALTEGGPSRRLVRGRQSGGLADLWNSDRLTHVRRRTTQSEEPSAGEERRPSRFRQKPEPPTITGSPEPRRVSKPRGLRGQSGDASERPPRAFQSAERRNDRRADSGNQGERAEERARPQRWFSRRPVDVEPAPLLQTKRSHEALHASELRNAGRPMPEPPRPRTLERRQATDGPAVLPSNARPARRERAQGAEEAPLLRERSRFQPSSENPWSSKDNAQRGRRLSQHQIDQTRFQPPLFRQAPSPGVRSRAAERTEGLLDRQVPSAPGAARSIAGQPRFDRRPGGPFAPAAGAERGGGVGRAGAR